MRARVPAAVNQMLPLRQMKLIATPNGWPALLVQMKVHSTCSFSISLAYFGVELAFGEVFGVFHAETVAVGVG